MLGQKHLCYTRNKPLNPFSFEHHTEINHVIILSFNLTVKKEEETVYDEVKVKNETADTNGKL